MVKNLPAKAGNTGGMGSIPGPGRSSKEGNDNPLQYSCLENPMDSGAWRATVRGVAKSWTQLSTHRHTQIFNQLPISSLELVISTSLFIKMGHLERTHNIYFSMFCIPFPQIKVYEFSL